jgi:hypothetical protein
MKLSRIASKAKKILIGEASRILSGGPARRVATLPPQQRQGFNTVSYTIVLTDLRSSYSVNPSTHTSSLKLAR